MSTLIAPVPFRVPITQQPPALVDTRIWEPWLQALVTLLNTGVVQSITGTANQVIASAAVGDVTLSLPQSIATSSTPQFAKLGIGVAPTRFLDVLGTTEQARLAFDASNYASFTVASTGAMTMQLTGTDSGYTFLPAGTGRFRLTSGTTTGTTNQSGLSVNVNSLTTGTGLYVASSTLTSGLLADLQVSGTAAAASQTALNILTTGANGTGGITTYGAQISNTHSTNTSTNVALKLNASGGATRNDALLVNAGLVGFGTLTPNTALEVSAATDVNNGQVRVTNGGGGNAAGISWWTGGGSTMRNWQFQSNYSLAGDFQLMKSTTNTGNPTTLILAFEDTGNMKLAGAASRGTTEGTNHFDIFDGTAPVGTLANGISLYSTSGELRVMDAAGNATLLSPHDRKTEAWIYDSVNAGEGKGLRIEVERIFRFIDTQFGLGAVRDYDVDATGHDTNPPTPPTPPEVVP